MKKFTSILPVIAGYFFILLFVYAAVSKLMEFSNFQVQLAQSPLLSAYAGFVSYAVIIVELIIAVFLSINRTRLLGLYASFGLMISFTVYIYLILNFSEFIPCSCGGILEKMGWEEHMVFNIACVLLAIVAIIIMENQKVTSFKRYFAQVSIIALLSIGTVIILFQTSEHIIKKENNFTRRFLPHPIDHPKKLDLKVNSFYFAGQHGDTIFLGNKTAPLIMGIIYPNFKGIVLDTLTLSNTHFKFQEIKLQVIYPYFILSDGHVPVVFEGKFPNTTASLVSQKKAYFSRMLSVAPTRHIFRAQSAKNRETIMGLLNTQEGEKVDINTRFLEKQMDGIFDTDGNMVVDPATKKLIYTYFYRNEYRILDSTLVFSGKGNTIDTTTKAKIELVTLKDKTVKMKSPPLKVNRDQAAYDGYLFNEASLRGKHEPEIMWKEAKIIDVYHYPTATYRYSFYAYHEGKDKMRSMLVTEKHFYVLTGNNLIRYKRMR